MTADEILTPQRVCLDVICSLRRIRFLMTVLVDED